MSSTSRPASVHLREAAFSALLGIGVVFLLFMTRPQMLGWRMAVYGALTGLAIFFSCRTLHRLTARIPRVRALPPPLVAAVVFFAGGVIGWSLASLVAQATGLTRWNLSGRDVETGLAIAGCLGIVLGLAFFFFGRMRNQLAESVIRLKEAEFAEKELEVARSIQARLLPPAELAGDGYRVFARNLPARFVAGDFYDVFHLGDGSLGLVVADVSGKGLGASLIMATVKAVVPLVAADRSAADALTQLNRKLAAELSPRDFVALCFARFDPALGALEIANAGLPDPYLLRGDCVEELTVPGPRLPLGARPDVVYESLRLELSTGERVLFMTDGLPESPTSVGEPLGYEALARLIASASTVPGNFLGPLLDSVRTATSDSLEDDWTALLLERSEPAASIRLAVKARV